MPTKEEGSFFTRHEFFISLLFFMFFILILMIFENPSTQEIQACGDGTPYNTCSITKPYYCDNGFLIEKVTSCGCTGIVNGNSCSYELQTESRNINLEYVLYGEEKILNFKAYKGLTDYLSNLSQVISYTNGNLPNRSDFSLRKINEEKQRELLMPLVIQIQNLTNNKEDQARIAVSLVQNIEYGFSDKTNNFFGKKVNYSRYPYEVLYESEGICGEKSELLAFLLKEIGYEVVLFYNLEENHESVGIKCPLAESYKGTGYCFIETTGSAIITDDSIEYVGGITLDSQPEILIISEGKSLPENLQEYRDAETMKRIRSGKFVLFADYRLESLKEKYGLVEEYNIA